MHDPERVDIYCFLKFRKDIRDQLLTVRVILTLSFKDDEARVVYQERISVAAGTEKRLRIGSISIARPGDPYARHDLWGAEIGEKDVRDANLMMCPYSRNIVEISLPGQTYRVFAQLLNESREEQRRVYLLPEEHLPGFKN